MKIKTADRAWNKAATTKTLYFQLKTEKNIIFFFENTVFIQLSIYSLSHKNHKHTLNEIMPEENGCKMNE